MFKSVSPLIPVNRLLFLINSFRLAVVTIIVILSLLLGFTGVPMVQGLGFFLWVGGYSIIILMSVVNPRNQIEQNRPLSVSGVLDIVMMVLFMHLSGGIGSGFGILVLPFIATSSLLSSGRLYLAYGSIATLSIFASVIWYALYGGSSGAIGQNIFQAGLLSVACLFVSSVTSVLARTARYAVNMASSHEDEIANLNRLNDLALQGLRDAVIVLDETGGVQQFNTQAKTYFPFLTLGISPQTFGPFLEKWHNQQDLSFIIDEEINKQSMVGRAVPVMDAGKPILLLFLRSSSELAAEAHKIKLESLGRLTANIAHEIRNPLSAVRHATELLAENHISPSEKQLTQMINNNVARIDRLLEEVLTLSKRDRLNPEWVALKPFMLDFLGEFEIAHPDAQGCIQLRFDSRVEEIVFDKGHLQQILWNLTNNAWRHSQKNPQAVAIAISWQIDQIFSIFIYDNGTGVSTQIVDKLFEPFFTTEKKGTGLGLYIAKELAQANGGQLVYQAKNNCFVLICKAQPHDSNT